MVCSSHAYPGTSKGHLQALGPEAGVSLLARIALLGLTVQWRLPHLGNTC